MGNFLLAFEVEMKIEGGHANDLLDRGGETYKGIARKIHPKWDGWPIIDSFRMKPGFPMNLDGVPILEQYVRDFYRLNYWEVNSLSQIKNNSIALEMFDTGVNMGVGIAGSFLRRSLNLLNRNGKTYRDLPAGSSVGPITLDLVNKHPDPEALYNTMNTLQGARYIAICEKDPTQERFFNGWLKRSYTQFL